MRKVLLILVMVVLSLQAGAQLLGYDAATLHAFASAHRWVGAEALTRASIETLNSDFHDAAASNLVEYKEINARLDKWKGFFGAIDVTVNSLQTVASVYVTVSSVKDDGEAIYGMMSTFIDQCTLRGDIQKSDLDFVNEQRDAIRLIIKEGEDFWLSCGQLAQYLTGLRECKTETLVSLLRNMNDVLASIRQEVRELRDRVFQYTYLRTHYWKPKLFEKRRLESFGSSCFDRWKTVAANVR